MSFESLKKETLRLILLTALTLTPLKCGAHIMQLFKNLNRENIENTDSIPQNIINELDTIMDQHERNTNFVEKVDQYFSWINLPNGEGFWIRVISEPKGELLARNRLNYTDTTNFIEYYFVTNIPTLTKPDEPEKGISIKFNKDDLGYFQSEVAPFNNKATSQEYNNQDISSRKGDLTIPFQINPTSRKPGESSLPQNTTSRKNNGINTSDNNHSVQENSDHTAFHIARFVANKTINPILEHTTSATLGENKQISFTTDYGNIGGRQLLDFGVGPLFTQENEKSKINISLAVGPTTQGNAGAVLRFKYIFK